jgi:hypothetical protein
LLGHEADDGVHGQRGRLLEVGRRHQPRAEVAGEGIALCGVEGAGVLGLRGGASWW